MDNREILTRFKDGTLGRRHALTLLSGVPDDLATPDAPDTPAPAARDAARPADDSAGRTVRAVPDLVPAGGRAEPCAVIALQTSHPRAAGLDAFWREALGAVEPYGAGDRPDAAATFDAQATEAHAFDAHVFDAHVFDAAAFDPVAFGLTDAEAARVDPRERLLLHGAREVLDSAGHAGARLDALTGPGGERRAVGVFTAVATTGEGPSAASRLSYLLDLRGPSQNTGTGPSAFLTALHLALGALRAGECAAALVGAAEPHPAGGPAGGTCVTTVLLKPLAAALAAGDVVHAVVLAGAAAHPGRGPRPGLPDRLRRYALDASGVLRAQVGLVESTEAVDTGSVGGAAAFTRAVLQLRHATLLPGPGRDRPGAWQPARASDGGALPRTAVVGVHEADAQQAVVVLREAPAAPVPRTPGAADEEPQLVLLSAPSPEHLAATAGRLAARLAAATPDPGTAAVARELRLGRAAQDCRLALVAHSTSQLARDLADFAAATGPVPSAVRHADLRALSEGPLLLGELAETRAYIGALWRARRFEQLVRLWLAGVDVLAPDPGEGVHPVLELPPGALLPRRPADGPGGTDADAHAVRRESGR